LLAVTALAYEASATVWTNPDCDDSSMANSCPAGSKYAKSILDYTVLGGGGGGTNWRIDQRIFAASTGNNVHPNERWKLERIDDWRWNGSSWVYVGQAFGQGTWRYDPTWSPLFVAGSPLTINASYAIGTVTGFRYELCEWEEPSEGVKVCAYMNTTFKWQDNVT
jgi:hypothetical protein